MDVKHLKYILMIAREKNISRAAEKLYMSQSSLSYVVTTLEKELGTPLFLRHKNGIELTEAGEKYVKAAEKVVRIREELYQDIAGIKAKATISVAATSQWGTRLFAEAVPQFQKRYPQTNFRFTHAELIYVEKEFQNGNVDFAFVSTGVFNKKVANMHLLRKEEMYLAIPMDHPFRLKKDSDSLSLSELSEYFSNDNFFISRPGSANRIVAENVFRWADYHPHITEINGLPITCDMIASGQGITFLPESGTHLQAGFIRLYHMDPMLYRYNVLITKPKANFTEMDRAFLNFALNLFKKT